MQQVTFTKALRPYGKGDSAIVPDDMAARLVKNGEAENPRPFPPKDVAPTVAAGATGPTLSRKTYLTRKRG